MKFGVYLRDRLAEIGLFIILFLAVLAVLVAVRAGAFAVAFTALLFLLLGAAMLLYGFFRKRSFYSTLTSIRDRLDQKYLLAEMLPRADFLEGKILSETIYETDKAMNEQLARYKRQTADFRDFIELWVHEVKAPLSSLGLALRGENRRHKIYLKEIADHIDRALFYAKVDTVDKDYVIKKVNLETVINEVVKANKDALIDAGIKIVMEDVNITVSSDPKWLRFIVNQVVLNAIKYRRDKSPEISLSARRINDGTELMIRDNGIGVEPSELKRVFEKGFTGANGRGRQSSTGMGLYISRKLCEDLGHKINIESEVGEYTEVTIVFGDNRFLQPAAKA